MFPLTDSQLNRVLIDWEYQNNAPPENEDATCNHTWKLVGTANDGTAFYKCLKCGEESEP